MFLWIYPQFPVALDFPYTTFCSLKDWTKDPINQISLLSLKTPCIIWLCFSTSEFRIQTLRIGCIIFFRKQTLRDGTIESSYDQSPSPIFIDIRLRRTFSMLLFIVEMWKNNFSIIIFSNDWSLLKYHVSYLINFFAIIL